MNTATLTDLPTPVNIATDARVYRLDPPFEGTEYVAASTITADEHFLIALLGAKIQTSLFIAGPNGSPADPDKFLGSTLAGMDQDVAGMFATIGYTVAE